MQAAPRARAAAVHRRRSARPRGVVLPLAHADLARAREAVGRSFVRSFGRSSPSSGRSPSRCSPGAATRGAARALLAPCRRFRDGSTLSRRSTRRPAPPALNAERLSPCFSARSPPVAATARRPPAAESLLLAARRGDARACCSRPLGRTPRSRQLDTRPSLVAAACASCAERGASHAPCSAARSHARGRDGSTAASRRVAAARRSSRRRSRALLAPARSAAAFATARHSAAARCGGLRLLR